MNLTERFLIFFSFPTASDEESELTPSTPRQLALAEYLADELSGLGLDVKFDRASGCVYGWLPGNGGADGAIGFISHMDTSPSAPGSRRTIASVIIAAGISPPVSTKSPILYSRVIR